MKTLVHGLLLGMALTMTGCAHNIKITPDLKAPVATVEKSQKVVGYFISDVDKAKVTTTPGGGGDKVSYQMAKDLEYPLYRVLSERYQNVKPLTSMPSPELIKTAGLSLVITPVFSSNSSGSSMLIWPADKFSISMNCKAYNEAGDLLLDKVLTGNGTATNRELMSNFALAANRAAEDLLNQLRAELANTLVLN